MKNLTFGLIAFIGLILLLWISGTFYIVDEKEQVVITRLGKPVREPVTESGLHFKLPFIEKATSFDKRLLPWDGSPNQIPTKDKKYIWVDTFARWRIVDPLLFLQSVRDIRGGLTRLDDIIDGATRDVITNHNLIEIVRTSSRPFIIAESESNEPVQVESSKKINFGREKLVHLILVQSLENVSKYGIELRDFRIKHINYVEDVRRKVYDRMIAERKRAAEEFRSEGQGRKAEIEGEIEKELKKIISMARRKALEIKGKADAKAISIYANAYNRDPQFYSFTRTLESYRKTLKEKSTILLTTDSEYLKYLNNIHSRQ